MHVGELSIAQIIFSPLKQRKPHLLTGQKTPSPHGTCHSHGQRQPHAAVPLSSLLLSRGKSCWMEKCKSKQLP